MTQSYLLSVVIPALNEEDGIANIIKRVLAVGPALVQAGLRGLELIVVDDGSTDGTAREVRAFSEVRLLQHSRNRGYGAALKTGLSKAQGELVAFLDADGTYPPEYFPQLCQAAMNGHDLVIGTRMAKESKSQMPPIRRLGNFIFANMLTVLGTRRITDSASGMRVIRREKLPQLYPLPDGLNFTPIMSVRAMHEGLSMLEVPIPYSERVGRSKLSVVKDGMRYVKTITWTTLSYNPARVLGIFGLIGVAIAALVGIGLLIARLQGVTALSAGGVAAIFLALVSVVSGVTLFNLGATFNYLVALFRKKPVQAGLFGKPIFNPPLDRQFGWMGLLSFLLGGILAIVVLILGYSGWEITRLWLYWVGSAILILVGLQLGISWLVMRILEELSEREIQAQQDIQGL